ncbi:MAG: type II toxin-antitoxin system VapC family toxin [Terriglobales bacterium]|jgi:PIN domain nuclease of toxin-antitoxin system
MRTLLDTHAFLWGIAGDRRMSQHARDIFIGPSNLLMSIASIWEILIKVQLGKLNLPQPAGPYIIRKLAENRIEVLPITLDHVLGIESLPLHHRDPFDRLLIAQSIEEGWPIITADPWFARYPVEVIW